MIVSTNDVGDGNEGDGDDDDDEARVVTRAP
jgi:hypothetical protein